MLADTLRQLAARARFWRRKPRRNPVIVGSIWRWDFLDALTDIEAEHWDYHILPWGWSIVADDRREERRFARLGDIRDDTLVPRQWVDDVHAALAVVRSLTKGDTA